ncbi:uncharacterized protein LOC132630720 [Lycium barbarum]|uniref:uncharacterized protein LOC132630720 n=1 Tax=Lycium barbarum TaxID=112863 RepID=UPI00293E3B22|nr:uncharacterized protein LOC132630720 [Lycium barbarum]
MANSQKTTTLYRLCKAEKVLELRRQKGFFQVQSRSTAAHRRDVDQLEFRHGFDYTGVAAYLVWPNVTGREKGDFLSFRKSDIHHDYDGLQRIDSSNYRVLGQR